MKPGDFALNTLTGEHGEILAVDNRTKAHAIFAGNNTEPTLIRTAFLHPVELVATSEELLEDLNEVIAAPDSLEYQALKDSLCLGEATDPYSISWVPYLNSFEVSYRDTSNKTASYISANLSLDDARRFIKSLGEDNA